VLGEVVGRRAAWRCVTGGVGAVDWVVWIDNMRQQARGKGGGANTGGHGGAGQFVQAGTQREVVCV